MRQTPVVVAKIDTVDYSYPSCGGYVADVRVVSGVRASAVVTLYSNYSGCITDRKVKLSLRGVPLGIALAIYHGCKDRDGDDYNIWDIITEDYLDSRCMREDYVTLRRGYKVF